MGRAMGNMCMRSQWEYVYVGIVPLYKETGSATFLSSLWCEESTSFPAATSKPFNLGGIDLLVKSLTLYCFVTVSPKWLSHQFLPGKVPSSNLKSSVLLQSFPASLWRVGRPGYLHEKAGHGYHTLRKDIGIFVAQESPNSLQLWIYVVITTHLQSQTLEFSPGVIQSVWLHL